MIGRTATSQIIDPATFGVATSSTQIVSEDTGGGASLVSRLSHSVAVTATVLTLVTQAPTSNYQSPSRFERRETFIVTGGEDQSLQIPKLVWPMRHPSREPLDDAPTTALSIAESPIVEAIRWMREAGLPKSRLATLLDISRPALDAWEIGASVPHESNRQRVFAIRDILERSSRRLPSGWSLADWLDTPRGTDAVTPAALIAAGNLARARLLAMSTISPGLNGHTRRPTTSVSPGFRHLIEPRQSPLNVEPSGEPTLEDESN
jgi:hypothetical protein